MPAFPDPRDQIHYRYVSRVRPADSWDPDSVMHFGSHKTGADEQAIRQYTGTLKISIDAEQQRKAKRNGVQYSPDMEQVLKMSATIATILVMQRGWEGPDFVYPPWATTADGAPHPKRGQPLPCNETWLLKMDATQLEAIEQFLSDSYEPSLKDDDDVATFPETSQRLAEPDGERSGAGEVSVLSGD